MARKPNFGERVTNLRLQYGSQKVLADSLGVSVRTIRRWERRRKPPSGATTKFEKAKLRRRERYQRNKGERIMREHVERIQAEGRTGRAAAVWLNEILPRGFYGPQIGGGRQTLLPSDYPGVVREMISGKSTQVSFAVISRGVPGKTEVYILPPGETPGQLDHFLRVNTRAGFDVSLIEWDIDPTHDWLQWESAYWEGFRHALGY